jgi:hypothetical protein
MQCCAALHFNVGSDPYGAPIKQLWPSVYTYETLEPRWYLILKRFYSAGGIATGNVLGGRGVRV